MTKVRMMLWVLAVLLLVGFVAAGCGSASDQTKDQDKKKVEAKGQQAKQEAKNKLKAKGQQATQKANASKQEAKSKLKAKGERAKQEAEQKRGSRPGGSKKSEGY
jgi:preprotein translocase subunit SecD